MGDAPRTVTMLLRDWRAGDRSAFDELMPLVYGELHRLAAHYLRGERPDHTFRATELVSEAYLRLADGQHPELDDRVHFYAIAARSMRQILVEHARRRNRVKRGGGERPIELDEGVIAAGRPEQLLALDAALDELAVLDERKARVTELHYFGGLKHDEIAAALDIHVNTVGRDLRMAAAWLQTRLRA